MKLRNLLITMTLALIVALLAVDEASARAGGGRSFGSRGSRSYSRPASPYQAPSRPQAGPQQPAPAPTPFQQPGGGGFLRGMAGGIMGGLLGGMLFRSLGFGGMGGGIGGSGIGLMEILLIGGICYLIYRMMSSRRRQQAEAYRMTSVPADFTPPGQTYSQEAGPVQDARIDDVEGGVAHIRQMDASFDPARFPDLAMDIFFKVQGAWMNRDLAPITGLLTDEMRRILQADLDKLKVEGRINRLENIAVREVEIAEAWQEQGQDFLTVLIYANLLDYTTDEGGTVVAGSRTDPVKFEEYWTFTRPVGSNPWRLSSIDQK